MRAKEKQAKHATSTVVRDLSRDLEEGENSGEIQLNPESVDMSDEVIL